MVMSGGGQSSPGGSGRRWGGVVVSPPPWLNQSCTMNCSHAGTRTLRCGTGSKLRRPSRSRPTPPAWIGVVEIRRLFAKGVADRHVAAEPRAGHAHPGATEIIVTAVGRALVAGTGAALWREQRWIAFGI